MRACKKWSYSYHFIMNIHGNITLKQKWHIYSSLIQRRFWRILVHPEMLFLQINKSLVISWFHVNANVKTCKHPEFPRTCIKYGDSRYNILEQKGDQQKAETKDYTSVFPYATSVQNWKVSFYVSIKMWTLTKVFRLN